MAHKKCHLKQLCPNVWTHLRLADEAIEIGDIDTAGKILTNLFETIMAHLQVTA